MVTVKTKKYLIILITVIGMAFLLGYIFGCYWADYEGNLGYGRLENFAADYMYPLVLPVFITSFMFEEIGISNWEDILPFSIVLTAGLYVLTAVHLVKFVTFIKTKHD